MRTVLVLEDEPSLMKLLVRILTGHRVVEATSAEQALRLFADLNYQLDLVVADLSGPRMSGLRVAMHFRARLPGLPVILTSGYPKDGWSIRDCSDLAELGSKSVAIMQKPFQSQLFSQTAASLMEGAPVDGAEHSTTPAVLANSANGSH